VETEGLVEGLVVDEYGEEGEDVEEMGLQMSMQSLVRAEICLPVKCQRGE
jgi:hypothetical protein